MFITKWWDIIRGSRGEARMTTGVNGKWRYFIYDKEAKFMESSPPRGFNSLAECKDTYAKSKRVHNSAKIIIID